MTDSSNSSRRRFLKYGTVSLTALAGCSSQDQSEETRTSEPVTNPPSDQPTETVETEEPAETETQSLPKTRLEHVWAFYYPWYKGDEEWLKNVPESPELGRYDSWNEKVVGQHLDWIVEHGIDALCVNWARTPYRETWIEDRLLPAERSDEISFFMQPATLGRFEWQEGTVDFDNRENRRVLKSDLKTFAEKYFHRENYLHIDEKPVVYWFASGAFRGDVAGAFREAEAEIGKDVYQISDSLGDPTRTSADRLAPFQGIAPYNPYDPSLVSEKDFEGFLDSVLQKYLLSALASNHADFDFFPTVIPGYDESRIDSRDRDFPVLERHPERFKEFCERASQFVHPERNAVFVTSFNEWPEYTAIEPSESYGTAYLETAELALRSRDVIHRPSGYESLILEFNKTVNVNGNRPLSFMLGKLVVETSDGSIKTYNIGKTDSEPIFIEGAYFPEENDTHDPKTWRWLGGPTERTVMYVKQDIGQIASIAFVGKPVTDNEISATVHYKGEKRGHIQFRERRAQSDTYRVNFD